MQGGQGAGGRVRGARVGQGGGPPVQRKPVSRKKERLFFYQRLDSHIV